MKSKLGITLALLAMFNFSTLNAAPVDKELAILASEQTKNEKVEPAEEVAKPAPKTKKELEAEQKRLREERRAEEKRLREEREAARKQIEEGKKEQIDLNTDRRTRNTAAEIPNVGKNTSAPTTSTSNSNVNESEKKTNTPTNSTSNTKVTDATKIDEPKTNLPNPITQYQTYEELSQAVNFAPLYIPKKSGYTVNEFLSINDKVAEIRYGRRWEPEVSLSVRTYKRAPNEELQDISGVQGAKWRVDESAGSTLYLTKINDTDHAAAWAVGNYTFSAYVQNLSFAAFYALVVEELVDLSNHYYVV